MSSDLIHPSPGRDRLAVDPAAMRWEQLGFAVYSLAGRDELILDAGPRETAVIPMNGMAVVETKTSRYELARRGVFEEAGSLIYLPPNTTARISTNVGIEIAVGTAHAEGRYSERLISPEAVQVEIRGGGPARRQVNHVLAPPLAAERLIVYEVYVPGGSWAGWPPHRHDGVSGSPRLEETYFFRFDRPDGFGFHRNYDPEGLDETFTVRHDDCVAVPGGFHVTATTPGNNMWILNFLAGDLEDDDRAAPPYFDPATTWIWNDWSQGQVELPVGDSGTAAGR
jgi:5-deoxy-glucuronate isomerase